MKPLGLFLNSKKYIVFAIWSFIIASIFYCKEDNSSFYNFNPSAEIHLDSEIDPLSQKLDAISSNEEDLLAYYNKFNYEVLIWNLSTSELISAFKIPREGPDSFSPVSGIQFLDSSRLILSRRNFPHFQIININGEIERNIPFYKYFDQYDFVSIPTHNPSYKKIRIDENRIYVPQVFYRFVRNKENTPDLLQSHSILHRVNLSNFEDEPLCATFPPDYMKNGFYEGSFSMDYGRNKFVFSFIQSHKLGILTPDSCIHYISAKSKFAKPFVSVYQAGPLEFYKNFHYRQVRYDPKTSLFLRVVVLEEKNKEAKISTRIALQSINVEGQVVSETLLPENLNYKHFLVTKNNIWISLNNPVNEHYDEEKLQFLNISSLVRSP